MVYALDKKGIALIRNSGAVYDCRKYRRHVRTDIINRYEIGMSQFLLKNGHSIRSIIQNTTIRSLKKCDTEDLWYPETIVSVYGGRMPSIRETIFWKGTRFLTDEVADLLDFKREITGVCSKIFRLFSICCLH